jgi:hypothetical protein
MARGKRCSLPAWVKIWIYMQPVLQGMCERGAQAVTGLSRCPASVTEHSVTTGQLHPRPRRSTRAHGGQYSTEPSGWIYHPVCESYGGQSESFLRRRNVVQEQTGADSVHRDLVRPCFYTRSAPTPGRKFKRIDGRDSIHGWLSGRREFSLLLLCNYPPCPRPG